MTAAAVTKAVPPKGSGSGSKKAPGSTSSSQEGPSYKPIAMALAATVTRGVPGLELLRQALKQHPEAVNGTDEKDQTPAIYGGWGGRVVAPSRPVLSCHALVVCVLWSLIACLLLERGAQCCVGPWARRPSRRSRS